MAEILQLPPPSPPQKKKKEAPPDGNKLAAGVSGECWSLKAEPASKWLNLAFVEAENSGWSPAHDQPRWKSIGSLWTRGLIKTGAFSPSCLDDTVWQKSLSSAPTTRHVQMVAIPFDPPHCLLHPRLMGETVEDTIPICCDWGRRFPLILACLAEMATMDIK